MYRLKHIIVLLFTILCGTGLYSQVHIGDGVTIGEGANFIISNQDVIIDTDEIKGEGQLIVQNKNKQKIAINQAVKLSDNLNFQVDNANLVGKHATKFTAMYLPKLSKEVRLAAKIEEKENVQEELPVRYINIEGLVYSTKDEQPNEEPVFKSLPDNQSGGVVISEVYQLQAVDFEKDYIIPIYSTLNDVRFSDDAELYEFESLTAIFKPPIV